MSIHCFGIRKNINTKSYSFFFFKPWLNMEVTKNLSRSLSLSLSFPPSLSPLLLVSFLQDWVKSKDSCTSRYWHEESFMYKMIVFQNHQEAIGREGELKMSIILTRTSSHVHFLPLYASAWCDITPQWGASWGFTLPDSLIIFFLAWPGRVKSYSYEFKCSLHV